ncbi:hypothetical protein V6Z90_006676 [Aspergillus fumigatus]
MIFLSPGFLISSGQIDLSTLPSLTTPFYEVLLCSLTRFTATSCLLILFNFSWPSVTTSEFISIHKSSYNQFTMSPIQFPIDAIASRFGDRFNSVRAQSLTSRFSNLRPISEFLDVKRLSKPANFGEVQSRVNYNLAYFSSNYAAVFVMLSIYSLLTNLSLLLVILLVAGGLYGIGKLQGRDLDLGFARFTTSQLYTGLLIVAVPLGLYASPIATALWLIGATGVTVFGHAAFMDKPIENAFSEEAV